MTYTLSLKPTFNSRTNFESGSGPVTEYEVEGLPTGRKISIRNSRASAQEPVWKIGAHFKGYQTKWTGAFKTAQDALAYLQEGIDSAEEEEVGEVAQ